MTLILSGTNGLSDVDGDASTPAIRGTDANTGIFFPAADNIAFTTGGTIRGRWTTDGLCFNADTAAANALDDYEEGTWTPAYAFSTSGSATTTGSVGIYVKIGRMVTVSFRILTPSISSPVGDATITGLPFTSSNDATNLYGASILDARRFATDMPNLRLGVGQNSSSITLFKHATNAASVSPVLGSDFSASASFNILGGTVTYFV